MYIQFPGMAKQPSSGQKYGVVLDSAVVVEDELVVVVPAPPAKYI